MKKKILLLLSILQVFNLFGQVIVSNPFFSTINDDITITFDASLGNQALKDFTGDIYAHTGLITASSTNGGDWKYVKTSWGENTHETKLTRISTNIYELKITPNLISYYGVPTSETVLQIAFVFRNTDGSKQGKTTTGSDIFLDVYTNGLNLKITSPSEAQIVPLNTEIIIEAQASNSDVLTLFIDEQKITTSNTQTLSYTHTASVAGGHNIRVQAEGLGEIKNDETFYLIEPTIEIAELPTGMHDGINYVDNQTVTLVLYAPYKQEVFVIGDFNNWQFDETYYMKRTPDAKRYWLTISGLTPQKEYLFQYLIDRSIRIADPYTEKVSDPWNDKYITAEVYPNLIAYPDQKTSGIAASFQTAQTPYAWQTTNFVAPKKEDLVIYELHLRDYTANGDIKTVMDTLNYLETLGVNAIELMPINEFEGNDSWGYNPSFYFATDKAYGTKNDYKAFIDECHRRGIAVFIDMVLNHSYSQSPFLQMYFNAAAGEYGQPQSINPWYNETSPNTSYSWGYDFNHESEQTKTLVDSITHFWLTEYQVDGFRFDFTKGFTNVGGDGWTYDASRIAILKRMADEIWKVKPAATVILEHLADNTEEKVLANYGMLLWGNINHAYNQSTMGYASDADFSWASYQNRGWTQANLIAYMESHDEERLMYKNLQWGNKNDNYDITKLWISLQRMELAAAFYFTIPGPKMIWQFGELGYDYSIDHNDRVGRKPIRWDYFEISDRKRLYQVYSELIGLKKELDVFESSNYSLSVSGLTKRMKLSHADMNMIVIGNFGIEPLSINPDFHSVGTWYDYFSGESIEITNTIDEISLQPGEYRLYTDKQLNKPEIITSKIEILTQNIHISVYPNPSNDIFSINFDLMKADFVHVSIIDSNGRLIETLNNKELAAHTQYFTWNATKIEAGVYFLLIRNSNGLSTHQLILN